MTGSSKFWRGKEEPPYGYAHPRFFYFLAFLSAAIFLLGLYVRVSQWMVGKSNVEVQACDEDAVKTAAEEVLLQPKLRSQSQLRWAMHTAIYWGFVMLFLQSLWLMVLQWFIPRSRTAGFFQGYPGQALLNLWGDFWGLLLSLGVIVALVRRYVLKTPQLHTLGEDALPLWLLLGVSLTGFAAEGVRLAGGAPATGWAFIGRFFKWLPAVGIRNRMVLFWVHGVLSLALIAYIPFGKLLHLVAAPIELWLVASTGRDRTGAP
jgi:nitrate reductase gamma subunit